MTPNNNPAAGEQQGRTAGLEWYANGRGNHGRGRVTGNSAKLLKAGLLTLRYTSRTDWVLTLTDSGRAALASVSQPEQKEGA